MTTTHAEESQELATTLEFAAEMEAAFADIVGTPAPKEKGEGVVLWYLRARQRLGKCYADIEATFDELVHQAEVWLEVQGIAVEKRRDYLDKTYLPTVEAVTRAKIAHSGKKSFDFCYGVCGFRTSKGLEWPDGDEPIADETLVKWAKENCPDAVTTETVTKVSKNTIKAYIKDTGDEPPMVKVTPGVEQFYVKPTPLALPSEPKLLGKEG